MTLLLAVVGCSGASNNNEENGGALNGDYTREWFQRQSVSTRVGLSVPRFQEWLASERVSVQLGEYDPGRAARCTVVDDPDYRSVIDELGGVQWNYWVNKIPDASKPIFMRGYPEINYGLEGDLASGSPPVEIAEADIVGLSDTSALFLSDQHGLMMLDLSGKDASFRCAVPLPGKVDQFYLHDGRLVVMVEGAANKRSSLLHFKVTDDELSFIEAVDLGTSRVLDSRRFNDRLVIYTDLKLEGEAPTTGGDAFDWGGPIMSTSNNRVLRVFNWGDTLSEELSETRVDDSPNEQYLTSSEIDRNTPPGTPVSQSTRFGSNIWASDKYFVVAESVTDTSVKAWETRTYSMCVESHTEISPYKSCSTQYKTIPNPAYVAPNNSGGDRACTGSTLSDCIRRVSKESAKTIQVPTGTTCVQVEREEFVCDRYEQRSNSYPTYNDDTYTRLYIYEYTEDGFIRFQDDVEEIDEARLAETDLDSTLDILPMSDAASQLRIDGDIEALQFQNGYLYVIAQGLLQTYALSTSSLIRTSSLKVNSGVIQSTQFTENKLYLSDASYLSGSGDMSVLRVIDLANGAFPRQLSRDTVLPGGHESIRPTSSGILTTGYVQRFEGNAVNMLKLGLFEDPTAVELSYLFIGTDLEQPRIGDPKATYYDSNQERLFLPYAGYQLNSTSDQVNWASVNNRVGVSHIDAGELVTEGAVDLPEQPQRVRLRPGTEQMLSFASSSIQSLSLGPEQWEATPVFEYFTPIGVYRYSDSDDYVEVLRLGNRCKLHFSTVETINERDGDSVTDAFKCPVTWPVGYEQKLLWTQDFGLEFSADGTFNQLPVEEATALWKKSQKRNVCLFSEDIVKGDLSVDSFDPPSLSTLRCYTSENYQANTQKMKE